MSLGSRGKIFLSGDQPAVFPFRFRHCLFQSYQWFRSTANSAWWMNSGHRYDSGSSDEQLLRETKLPLSRVSYFPTGKLNEMRTWGSASMCLSILWDCWPILDTAVGQDWLPEGGWAGSIPLGSVGAGDSRISCTGASQVMPVALQTRQCSECGMSYSLMSMEDI